MKQQTVNRFDLFLKKKSSNIEIFKRSEHLYTEEYIH